MLVDINYTDHHQLTHFLFPLVEEYYHPPQFMPATALFPPP